MNNKDAKKYLGCQIWLEPYENPDRVESLVKEAAECGLGWLRTFLIWPWIEEKPNEWNFTVFDALFDACAKYEIKVKATLTANSGPWHIGTPLLLHSHTGILDERQWPAIERYVAKCVTRYASHPALGQWILWNEPRGTWEKSDEARSHWQLWLKEKYRGDIELLNVRWRTGYPDFSFVQFPEEIARPEHCGNSWSSYRPCMDYAKFNAKWMAWELRKIQQLVSGFDPITPTCVNPSNVLNNDMTVGIDLCEIGKIVTCVGASYHPGWHFTFARRDIFPALMAVGVKKTASFTEVRRIEVTEVQTGNTLNSSIKPCNVDPSELARFYLSCIFSGAESVTGWLLNSRSVDYEAGDWGLLDSNDKQSPRSQMIRRIHDTLNHVLQKTGGFKAAKSDVYVAFDHDAQIVELADSANGGSIPGRQTDDGAFGSALLTAQLMQCGANATMCRLCDIPENSENKIVFLMGVVAWSQANAEKALKFASEGGTVVLDCLVGRKTPDAALYRPWPGVLADQIGMRISDLETDPKGYDVSLFGEKGGKWLLTRGVPQFEQNSHWKPWHEVRYEKDGAACVWERPYGRGRFVLVNGLPALSMVYESEKLSAVKYILTRITKHVLMPIRPVSYEEGAYAIGTDCEQGKLTVIIAGNSNKKLHIVAPKGKYEDLWSGKEIIIPDTETIDVEAQDGIVMLWEKSSSL